MILSYFHFRFFYSKYGDPCRLHRDRHVQPDFDEFQVFHMIRIIPVSDSIWLIPLTWPRRFRKSHRNFRWPLEVKIHNDVIVHPDISNERAWQKLYTNEVSWSLHEINIAWDKYLSVLSGPVLSKKLKSQKNPQNPKSSAEDPTLQGYP